MSDFINYLIDVIPNSTKVEGRIKVGNREAPFPEKAGPLVLSKDVIVFTVQDGPGVTNRNINSFLSNVPFPAVYLVYRSDDKVKVVSKGINDERSKDQITFDYLIHILSDKAKPSESSEKINVRERDRARIINMFENFSSDPDYSDVERVAKAIDRVIKFAPSNDQIDPQVWRDVGVSSIRLLRKREGLEELDMLMQIIARTIVYFGEKERLYALEEISKTAINGRLPISVSENMCRLAHVIANRVDPKKASIVMQQVLSSAENKNRLPPTMVDLVNRLGIKIE
ncbi:hypothetical protein [Bdellovibrio sp. HCB-110]|uniref:hypothetical protein n=1 Tax=Bdellovibrio sp. HCB-110 TaxID=3391182 RepID=UPI0039B60951